MGKGEKKILLNYNSYKLVIDCRNRKLILLDPQKLINQFHPLLQ